MNKQLNVEEAKEKGLTSMDIAEEKKAQFKQLFPEVFTEDKIDFDQLRRVLGDFVDADKERFGLNWPGKANCMKIIQQPSLATLKPAREESVDFDKTENLFIEGDNLEVLKLLQKAYFGKVKMIYIDPPYNTGKEFIYPDKYAENLDTYLEYTGQKDSEGRKFATNTDTVGRYHSNWLNMMYPRLYLAKNLLREDGVIFISIDDHEQANLKKLCDQIFGEENFLATFVWNIEGHTDNQFDVKVNHEYVILYAKNAGASCLGHVVDPNTREESNLWKGFAENSITKNGSANPPSVVELPVGFPCKIESLALKATGLDNAYFDEVKETKYISREITKKYDVSYPVRLSDLNVSNYKTTNVVKVFSGWANVNKLKRFIDNNCQPLDEDGDKVTFYLSENGVIYYHKKRERAQHILSVLRNMGTTEKMRSELEALGLYFKYPKPKELLKYLLQVGNTHDQIVLDFFAGSATTAQAVYELNQEKEEATRHICVQLPETISSTDPELKVAYDFCIQNNIPPNIAELSKERIRRAAKKTAEENPEYKGDLGFKVFKLAKSNFNIWEGNVEEIDDLTKQLEMAVDHVQEAAESEDILYELLLKAGFPLTTKVEKQTMAGKEVFSVEDGAMLICLENQLTQEVLDVMAEAEPFRVVCLDEGFKGNDELKANAVQTFKSRARDKETAINFTTV